MTTSDGTGSADVPDGALTDVSPVDVSPDVGAVEVEPGVTVGPLTVGPLAVGAGSTGVPGSGPVGVTEFEPLGETSGQGTELDVGSVSRAAGSPQLATSTKSDGATTVEIRQATARS